MKKILIIGCGAQGSVIARRISQEESVSEIICADYNEESAKELEKRIRKARAIQLDASNVKEIIEASKGVNLIVNAVPPNFNKNIMEAAFQGHVYYQDMASGPVGIKGVSFVKSVTSQLDLNEKWKKAGLRALINTGISPGMTNVIAKNCADDLVTCKKIKIWFYDSLKTGKFIPIWWSPETAWGDLVAKPTIFENDRFIEVEPFSNEEYLDIPGVGSRRFVAHEHEEVITLGLYIKGLEYAEMKMGGPICEFAQSLYKFGLLDVQPINVKGTRIVPLDVIQALTPSAPSTPKQVRNIIESGVELEETRFIVTVEGEKDGRKVEYINYINTPSLEESFRLFQVSPISYVTGSCAAVFTKLLIRDRISLTGVYPPEALDKDIRNEFLEEISANHITVDQIIKRRIF